MSLFSFTAEKPDTDIRNLSVQRVDGVLNPATGKPFFFLKAAGDDELRVNIENFASLVDRVVRAIHKSNSTLNDEQITKDLNDVVDLLGISDAVKFQYVKKEDTPAAEDKPAADPAPAAKAPEAPPAAPAEPSTPPLTEEGIAKAVVAGLMEVFKNEKSVEEDGKKEVPQSRQPVEPVLKSTSKSRDMGNGLFESLLS
jgi:uncharacterized membrane protein